MMFVPGVDACPRSQNPGLPVGADASPTDAFRSMSLGQKRPAARHHTTSSRSEAASSNNATFRDSTTTERSSPAGQTQSLRDRQREQQQAKDAEERDRDRLLPVNASLQASAGGTAISTPST